MNIEYTFTKLLWGGRTGVKEEEQQQQRATRATVTAWRISPKTNKPKKVGDTAKSNICLGGKFTALSEYTRKAINKSSIHLKKLKKNYKINPKKVEGNNEDKSRN